MLGIVLKRQFISEKMIQNKDAWTRNYVLGAIKEVIIKWIVQNNTAA